MTEVIEPKAFEKIEYMMDFGGIINKMPKYTENMKSYCRASGVEIIDCTNYALNPAFKTENY